MKLPEIREHDLDTICADGECTMCRQNIQLEILEQLKKIARGAEGLR
jgi:hypothetical protein